MQKGVAYGAEDAHPDRVVAFEDVREWLRNGTILRRLLRYQDVVLRTERLEMLTKPFATASLLRALSHGSCVMTDNYGNSRRVGVRTLAALGADLLEGPAQTCLGVRPCRR